MAAARTVALLSLALTLACTAPGDRPAPPPKPAKVTLEDFQQLRYLEGDWRGTDGVTAPFYERYRYENDSTIRSYSFADSTFRQATDSGLVTLAGAQARSTGASAVWYASSWGTATVRFDPERGATNSFSWTRQSHDVWTARLEPAGGEPTVYAMTRVHP
jgi:hypothetical protein